VQEQIVEHIAVRRVSGKRAEDPKVLIFEFRANAATGWAWADVGSIHHTNA